MRIVNTRVGVSLKALVAVATGLAALSGAARPAAAQLTTKPIVSSIQTSLGTKNGYPAMATFHDYKINGVNFSTDPISNLIMVEKLNTVNGVPTWQFYYNTHPSAATGTQLKANIGGASEGTYRLSIYVSRVGQSNWKMFLVVPPTMSLDQVNPASTPVGDEVTLKGNLFPMTSTHVVLTPPADMAKYMGERWVVPTSKSPFEIKFTVPVDLWGGSWKVRVYGAPGINTSQKSMTIFGYEPKYAVKFRGFTCLDLSADGPGYDETFVSMISYTPNSGSWMVYDDCSAYGTKVWEGTDTNTSVEEWITLGAGYFDPSKSYFIVAMGEADQYWWDIWSGEYWSNPTSPLFYAYEKADITIKDIYSYEMQNDPILKGTDIGKKALWIKNELQKVVGGSGDECLGSAIVKFTKDEVYQARFHKGTPVVKVLSFYGDSSHYKVEIQLVAYD